MKSHASVLRDFTVDSRVVFLSAVAIVIGFCASLLAVVLLRSIALATNLFYYHRVSFASVTPAASPLGIWMVAAPVFGGLLVGLMATYGSDKIRGHGIPEAIEAILLRGARVQPRVAVLKPLSAAISIGSGGPFGAEGPIIMTGGAFGSLVAQWLRLSDAERTTLLVAGAAAGMSATFAAPLAAILLGVELLLFEWRPRSLVPVAVASVTAGAARVYWLGSGPLFPLSHALPTTDAPLLLMGALALGVVIGFAAALLSRMVYGFEDLFGYLPVAELWWPAIGGLGVGLGGLLFPAALGVGYDNISRLLAGGAPVVFLLGILIVKSLIWSFSLGSGTSGGVLAPILMIGGALGAGAAALGHASPAATGLWALLGMGSMLAGSLGAPLTAIVFSVELTHQLDAALPLALACMAAHTVTSLVMARSILTERLSRRGYHLTREYGVDPLESVTLNEIVSDAPVHALPAQEGVFAYSDETCRAAAERMAQVEVTELPVLDRETGRVIGMVAMRDLLVGRRRALSREQNRVRVFRPPFFGDPQKRRAM